MYFEPEGIALSYLQAGTPCVVGNLWDIKTNNGAANGQFVQIQSGNVSLDSPPEDTNGILRYDFNLDATDTYQVYARVKTLNSNSGSFWSRYATMPKRAIGTSERTI